jgi:SAM-dependent methyltransferase
MTDAAAISGIVACPRCHRPLRPDGYSLSCPACDRVFEPNRYGYFDFIIEPGLHEIEPVTETYATIQHECGERVYEEYLRGYFSREAGKRILDVGCGLGRGITRLLEDGYHAYGVDLPHLSRFWSRAANSPLHFFCGGASHLPFADNFFDVVYSLGVIEHIGTAIGHCTLAWDYLEKRREFASEMLRVTRAGGRILLSCPNKQFPVDIQHGPRDALSPRARVRSFLFAKTGLNFHPSWGKYHLLSYPEARRLFFESGEARTFRPQSLKGFFGFSRVRPEALKSLATFYCNHLPGFLLPTFFNPYLLVEIRKS